MLEGVSRTPEASRGSPWGCSGTATSMHQVPSDAPGESSWSLLVGRDMSSWVPFVAKDMGLKRS